METAVTKTLDDFGITYVVTVHKKAAFSCEDVSRERKIKLAQVLKCMVAEDKNGNIYIMLVPGDRRVDIKKLCQYVGEPGINFVHRKAW